MILADSSRISTSAEVSTMTCQWLGPVLWSCTHWTWAHPGSLLGPNKHSGMTPLLAALPHSLSRVDSCVTSKAGSLAALTAHALHSGCSLTTGRNCWQDELTNVLLVPRSFTEPQKGNIESFATCERRHTLRSQCPAPGCNALAQGIAKHV